VVLTNQKGAILTLSGRQAGLIVSATSADWRCRCGKSGATFKLGVRVALSGKEKAGWPKAGPFFCGRNFLLRDAFGMLN